MPEESPTDALIGNTEPEEISEDKVQSSRQDELQLEQEDEDPSSRQDEMQSNDWPDLHPVPVKGSDKEQINPYVRAVVVQKLEQLWGQIRAKSGEKVTKSDMIEAALILAFREHGDQGEDGLFYRQILEAKK
jgi:hypothetical protein